MPHDLPADAGWSPAETATRPKTLAETALIRLQEDIVAGRLAPGTRLKPEELKQRYAIGTSPIREALLTLSGQGLVHLVGQRGFRVAPTSVADLMDLADIRTTLSCLALRRAVERGDAEWDAQIVAAFHLMERLVDQAARDPVGTSEVWEERNRNFHRALESACGSRWLLHFSHLAYSQTERYRRHYVRYGEVIAASQAEHRAIMEAALSRDAERACALLAEHIVRGAGLVRERLVASAGET